MVAANSSKAVSAAAKLVDALGRPKLWANGSSACQIQLTAVFGRVDLACVPFVQGLTEKTPVFAEFNSSGQVPFLGCPDNSHLSGWRDIALYLAQQARSNPTGIPFFDDDGAVAGALAVPYLQGSISQSSLPGEYLTNVFSTPAAVQVYGERLLPGQQDSTLFRRLTQETWTGERVRAAFLDFFQTKQHELVPSSTVVPRDDPTLLFANAGMNQFKTIFLGTVSPDSFLSKLSSATDTQKCIRAGGKHNDLDDVGKDVYHHTFFEMLGNWSFGDYFKEGAITMAWECLTKVFGLAPDRIYATYFGGDERLQLGPDEEARQIWLRVLPPERVLPFGSKDNFWEMGDQGPCGPCTEIHYDRIGGRDAASMVNMDDPNVLEIWNLVFIQYNREPAGNLKPLPSRHVDTGLGFERLTSVLQNKMSNYATDIFEPIFKAIQTISGARIYTDKVGSDDADGVDMAYRVVADHIRTLSFAIADGAQPGNEGRNYVLRRILRRAVRYGKEVLGAPEGFLANLVDVVVTKMGPTFPELVAARNTIHSSISLEEKNFGRTLNKGIARFQKLAEAAHEQKSGCIDGASAFQLWDVYGFPPDLTQLMAEEPKYKLQVDMEGFNRHMEQQRSRSRAAAQGSGTAGLKFEAAATSHLQKSGVSRTNDKPKFKREDVETELLAIYTADGFVEEAGEAQASSTMGLILRDTSFYAEMGGQVGDCGSIRNDDATGSFTVSDTKAAAGYVLHIGNLEGTLRVGEKVHAAIDHERRDKIMANHTSTHVLNHALRELLGEHINQSGSAVDEDRLRFDFTHPKKLEPQEVGSIESACQKGLKAQLPVFSEEVSQAEARKINGIRWLQDEKYPDPVRVVSIGVPVQQLLSDPNNSSFRQYSIEFCGGTHLDNTASAVGFVLVSEESSAT
ncbi:hypothetical protein WJX84_012314, partial [Apatococcus fuscideae]